MRWAGRAAPFVLQMRELRLSVQEGHAPGKGQRQDKNQVPDP